MKITCTTKDLSDAFYESVAAMSAASWPEDEAAQCVARYKELLEDRGLEGALSDLRIGMRHVVMIFSTEAQRVRYWNAVLAGIPGAKS